MRSSSLLSLVLLLFFSLSVAGCGGGGGNSAQSPTAVSLQSDSGDSIGGGKSYSYSNANAKIAVKVQGSLLSVTVRGDEIWTCDFQIPGNPDQLETGHYDNLQGCIPRSTAGGLSCIKPPVLLAMSSFCRYSTAGSAAATGNSGPITSTTRNLGIGPLTGWFAIDNVSYVNGVIISLDLRFEQHVDGAAPALHGQIHWSADDKSVAPGPVNPPPANLWQHPDSMSVGSYVYLESEPGDFIGRGQTYYYTPLNSQMNVLVIGSRLMFIVNGAQSWNGDFQAMASLTQLQPGYYGPLERYPFHNSAKGGA